MHCLNICIHKKQHQAVLLLPSSTFTNATLSECFSFFCFEIHLFTYELTKGLWKSGLKCDESNLGGQIRGATFIRDMWTTTQMTDRNKGQPWLGSVAGVYETKQQIWIVIIENIQLEEVTEYHSKCFYIFKCLNSLYVLPMGRVFGWTSATEKMAHSCALICWSNKRTVRILTSDWTL